MEEPDKKHLDRPGIDPWIKEHADSLDYPDVPEDRGYRLDDSKLSPEVQKAMADRRKQLAEQSKKSD